MERVWFPLRDVSNCGHLPVEDIRFLEADGNYTKVHYYDTVGDLKESLQSGNIGQYKRIIEHGFIYLRRNIIVNRSKVVKHSNDHTVTLASGEIFQIPKGKWKEVKAQLSKQLVIPFTKKGDSLNERDDLTIK